MVIRFPELVSQGQFPGVWYGVSTRLVGQELLPPRLKIFGTTEGERRSEIILSLLEKEKKSGITAHTRRELREEWKKREDRYEWVIDPPPPPVAASS